MITLFNNLLAKALLKRATTLSTYSAMAAADRENTRASYILKVLQASAGTRNIVKAKAAASNSPGQQQLAAILVMFDALSPTKKADFIAAYTDCAATAGLGTREVSRNTTWQQGNNPPVNVP